MNAQSGGQDPTPVPRAPGRRLLDAATARIFRMAPGRRDFTRTAAIRVPMRDGVQLLTDVYTPVGESRGTLLIRTPYGRSGLIAAVTARYLAAHGYRVVNQACRGTSGSGGDFEPFRREIEDGADAVDWLRGQPWFDGRFALVGTSYLGYTAWAIMTDPPPELVTAVISVSAHDNHGVAYGGGVFALEPMLSLFDGFAQLQKGMASGLVRSATADRRLRPGFTELPLVRAQDTVLAGGPMPYREWLEAPEADDPVWRPMRLGAALERIDIPILLQEGWQDRFVDQMLDQYDRLHRRGVPVALTIGPWSHVDVATKALGPVMAETFDWLDGHFAGGGTRRPAPVRIFVTGAEEWRDLPEWPPPTTEGVLYLHPGGELAEAPPTGTAPPSTFTYDPADPTPSVGGRVIHLSRAGQQDNRGLEARADVLTFTGPVLSEPWEVVGCPVVELAHETDNPYADLFVRLCEVDRRGRSTNLSDAMRRLGPGDASGLVRLRLDAIAHRFRPGTRLRLQVSGGAHPRYARNLGTEEDPATGTRLSPSHRTIGHGSGGVSRLLLPLTP